MHALQAEQSEASLCSSPQTCALPRSASELPPTRDVWGHVPPIPQNVTESEAGPSIDDYIEMRPSGWALSSLTGVLIS